MVVVYCVISFILGWRLSTWAKSEPFAAARAARKAHKQRKRELAQQSSVQSLEAAKSNQLILDELELQAPPAEVIDEKEIQELEALADDSKDESGAWFFDAACFDEGSDDCPVDAAFQAQKYFLDNFHDEEQLLSQRVKALKAALSMNESLLDDAMLEMVYQLLLKEVDESQHPEEITYLLGLMQGKVCAERLPGLIIYLKSGVPSVREEALKAIAPADKKRAYRKHVEDILHNDPQTEIRALAFVMLDQYYSSHPSRAA